VAQGAGGASGSSGGCTVAGLPSVSPCTLVHGRPRRRVQASWGRPGPVQDGEIRPRGGWLGMGGALRPTPAMWVATRIGRGDAGGRASADGRAWGGGGGPCVRTWWEGGRGDGPDGVRKAVDRRYVPPEQITWSKWGGRESGRGKRSAGSKCVPERGLVWGGGGGGAHRGRGGEWGAGGRPPGEGGEPSCGGGGGATG